jgi:hypothetical protein
MKHLICQIDAIVEVVRQSDDKDIERVIDALSMARSRLQGEMYGRQRDPRVLAQELIDGIKERRAALSSGESL